MVIARIAGDPRLMLWRNRILTVGLLISAFAVAAPGSASAESTCDGVSGIPGISTLCDAVSSVGGFVSDPLGTVGNSVFGAITDSILQGYQTFLGWALTWWIQLPTPKLAGTDTSLMSEINDHMVELQIFGLTVSIMFFAARMGWQRQTSIADDAEDGFKLLFRASLATSVLPIMLTAGGQISDGISEWLVREAIGPVTDDGKVIDNFLHLSVLTGSGIGVAGLFVIGLVGFLGALLQLAFLVVRQAMLLLVVAALPVAASFSGTGPGSQAYQKMLGWSVAFLLFKPVGALCYFIAFKAAGSDSPNEQQVLLGMVLMALCGFVLPSLMRLMGGVTGAMGAGASGAAAAGMAVDAAVGVASLAAAGAGAGAGAGASGAGSALSQRGGGPSGTAGVAPSSPPPTPPTSSASNPQRPGPQPAMSSMGPDRSTGGSSDGPKEGLTPNSGGSTSDSSSAVTSAMDQEADAGVELQPQPRLQSGWGEHAMSR